MRRLLPLALVIGFAYACLVTAAGGGVYDPNDPTKLNPEAGVLHLGDKKRCVTLGGDGWADPKPCGQPPRGAGSDARWVESIEGSNALSRDEVEALWRGAGGDPNQARTASAIAKAESGWRPDALGRNGNGTVDRGLWQINSIHGGLSTFDIHANAASAVRISSNGTNWGPWTTYGSGAYAKFL